MSAVRTGRERASCVPGAGAAQKYATVRTLFETRRTRLLIKRLHELAELSPSVWLPAHHRQAW